MRKHTFTLPKQLQNTIKTVKMGKVWGTYGDKGYISMGNIYTVREYRNGGGMYIWGGT